MESKFPKGALVRFTEGQYRHHGVINLAARKVVCYARPGELAVVVGHMSDDDDDNMVVEVLTATGLVGFAHVDRLEPV